MSIRPVDMQVLLPHATDVGKVQALQNEHNTVSQQLFAEKLQREAAVRHAQVQETQRSEFAKVNRDKERDQKERKKNKNAAPSKDLTDEAQEQNDKKNSHVSLNPILGKNVDVIS